MTAVLFEAQVAAPRSWKDIVILYLRPEALSEHALNRRDSLIGCFDKNERQMGWIMMPVCQTVAQCPMLISPFTTCVTS